MKTLHERKLVDKRLEAKTLPASMRHREFHAQPKVAYGPARHKKVRPQKATERE